MHRGKFFFDFSKSFVGQPYRAVGLTSSPTKKFQFGPKSTPISTPLSTPTAPQDPMALAPNPGSSPPMNGSRGEFHTPTRVRIRAFDSAGQTQSQIKRSMQVKHGVVISQSTISRILASSRNQRDQSGRIRRPRKLTDRSA